MTSDGAYSQIVYITGVEGRAWEWKGRGGKGKLTVKEILKS